VQHIWASKLYHIGPKGFSKYSLSPNAMKNLRQIFHDDNFTTFMLNTSSTEVGTDDEGIITSMDKIKTTIRNVSIHVSTLVVPDDTKPTAQYGNDELYSWTNSNGSFTFDVYKLMKTGLKTKRPEIVQNMHNTAQILQSQIEKLAKPVPIK